MDILEILEKHRVDRVNEADPAVTFSSEAEAMVTGMLYESGNLTLAACQSKARRIIGALQEIGWGKKEPT